MKDDLKPPSKEETENFREFTRIQREEIRSRDNMYFAFRALGREPTQEEAELHFALCSGAKDFRKKYGHLVCLYDEDDSH